MCPAASIAWEKAELTKKYIRSCIRFSIVLFDLSEINSCEIVGLYKLYKSRHLATTNNCTNLTEQHKYPDPDLERRKYCIRSIIQLRLAINNVSSASSLVSKYIEDIQAIKTSSKTRAERRENLAAISKLIEEIPYQQILAETTDLIFVLRTRTDEAVLELASAKRRLEIPPNLTWQPTRSDQGILLINPDNSSIKSTRRSEENTQCQHKCKIAQTKNDRI
uniref:Uncharacterized protein n=1 Tax=Heterorhabditis bacteriophora TaxID=37862 RepID=A0A1I7WUF6_HETBA